VPATQTAAKIGGEQSRTRVRAPGLDGVRALAVLAVIAFHEGLRAAPAGFLGVDVFFVLSGYLITDLLVSRRDRLGRLDLRDFWARRARRLLPALAVLLVIVTAAVAVIEPGQLGGLRPALAAAVTYSSNWYQALHHQSYFAAFGPPAPLQHLWSLAIEEQFYLVWPLVLLAILRIGDRRVRAGAAWLGAAASAAAMALVYVPGSDPSLVYYGTGTHATALLTGAAIALTWPLREIATSPAGRTRRLDMLGVAGFAVLAWAIGHFSGTDRVVYPIGLTIAALAAAGLVAASAAPGVVGGALSWAPLRWLGVRSYGIYLWHWPVIALAAVIAGPRASSPWLWAFEAAAAVGLAAASWRWVESPILRDGFRATIRARYRLLAGSFSAARRSPVGALPAIAAMAALTVACTAGYGVLHPPAASSGLQRQISRGARVSSASRTQPAAGAGPAASAAASPAPAAAPPGAPPPRPASGRVKIHGSQVTAIGDSVMLAAAPQLQSVLPGIYIDAAVSRQMSAGIAVIRSLAGRARLRQILVVGLGTNGTVTSQEIHQLLALAGPRREVVLVNTFVPRPWQNADNRVLAAAARQHPNVVLADWQHTIRHRTYLLWDDGIHPRPAGGRVYARMIKAAVQAARGAAGPAAAAGQLPVPFLRIGEAGRRPARLAP
jgi:peptidoglycan/LPS O-acetylase OafA/YrhL